MQKTTLVIMTTNQTDDSIIHYSVFDAVQAGFDKIIIALNKENETLFKMNIGPKIEKICYDHDVEIRYVRQELKNIPKRFSNGKRMNLGAGQAILAAKDEIDSQFVVISGDTYYGTDAFESMHEWLLDEHHDSVYGMAGFALKNTLSEKEAVTRGVCRMKKGYSYIIEEVVETSNIIKTDDGCEADGVPLDTESYVCMNMWGFPKAFLRVLEDKFSTRFNREIPENLLNPEFLLSSIIGNLIRDDLCTLTVVETA